MITITSTCTHSGQPRAYADSVFKFEITAPADATADQVWEAAQSLRQAQHRANREPHDGACGFPFGLQSYGSLHRISTTLWRYSVTEPYCD